MINKRPGAPVMASIKQVQYKAHHIPRGKTPRYWNEWLQLWWYRFGIETGISELEYFEKVFCCKSCSCAG